MIFRYKEITKSVKRPIIPLMIRSTSKVILYYGLIDSGADNCMFDLEIAGELGINLSKEDSVQFIGVGKEVIKGFWGNVELRIGNSVYKTRVLFAEISDFGHVILGQKGFFDHFDVNLSYKKQSIEIDFVQQYKN